MSTDSSPNSPRPEERTLAEGGGPLVIDGISYIPSSVLLTGIQKLTLKDNRAFGVLDPRGEAPRVYASSELGFFYNDTRHLSTWETTFNGQAPVALASELRFCGNTLVISMTNRDMPMLTAESGDGGRIVRDTFLIRRFLSLCEDQLFEIIAIRNFDHRPHLLQVEQWIGTRFDDIFEVRGFARIARGRSLPPEERDIGHDHLMTLRYEGLDRRIRKTHVRRLFPLEKIRLAPTLAGHFTRIEVPPKEDVLLKTIVTFDEPADGKLHGREFRDLGVAEALNVISCGHPSSTFSDLTIETDNAIVNRAIENAKTDIEMLLTVEPDDLIYPYAGIPWFSAPFGRDGMISAYQLLPWHPKLAQGVLEYAFSTLGTRVDDFTDEQPGKVFHEMRRGEMSNTREVPFIPYYGSVDSTPLCLILLHEYVTWTMDLENLRRWWPSALRALAWIEKWGDFDQDGFLEYMKQSPSGLVNQGWKDSHDSIMHRDGTLAQAPIRLCEVQGYAFRARIGMSELARLLGHHELSARLRIEALQLRAQFIERFWDDQRGFAYLALDGDRKPCAVLSSNMGHCLWSQIATPLHADSIAAHLTSEAMFSGYGIRTLADTEKAYNPLSYHNGSIWPHDNSLIMEGFRYYGKNAELERTATAMIDVLASNPDFRLPELFCGFRKRANEPPVPYEVACKPQAWAAGAVFLMLKSMIGISMNTDQDHVTLNSPLLTQKIRKLEIRRFRARDWEMDLVFRSAGTGTTVDIPRRIGKVRVLTVK